MRIASIVVVLCGLVAVPPVVEAARPSKCSAVQRRARTQLERGLATCGRKAADAEVGTCSAARWARYTSRLARRGCPAASDGPAGLGARVRPVLVKVRAAAASADDLALVDREARDAQLAFVRFLRGLEHRVRKAADSRDPRAFEDVAAALEAVHARWIDAEETLAAVEEAVWQSFSGDRRLPWLIDEPLRVAMEQIQIELRRLLGPEWHTEIASLEDEPPCRVDLVRDRLVAAYGRAVLGEGEAVPALARIAGELACESLRQATLTDVALGTAYDAVALRLAHAGLGRILDDLARLFAPVAVLTLDVVKLAGDHAYAWHWFVEQHARLKDAIARLGWPTDDVLWLHDRIDGQLVGFPGCTGDGDVGRCVDMPAFLDSLIDPRALGLGDCALSGMVAAGTKSMGGAGRYACPSVDCEAEQTTAPSTKGRGGAGSFLDRFRSAQPQSASDGQLPWSNLSRDDLEAMEEVSCGSGGGGGGAGGGGGSQGPGGSLGDWGGATECVESALHAPRDPYSSYVRCVAAATGRDDRLGLTMDFEGVPMGPECRPDVSNGSSSTTTPPGSSTSTTGSQATTTTAATTNTTSTTAAPSASVPCVPTGVLDAIKQLLDCGLPVLQKALGGTPKPGTSGPVGPMIELAKPENAKNFYDTAGGIMQNKVDLACATGTLSEDMCAKLATMKPGEQAEYLRSIGKLKSCTEEQECDAGCTSEAAQVMERMEDCQEALHDALTPDAPDPDDLVTTPTPDADTGGLPDDPLTQCLLASANDGSSGGLDLECALVSCADTASSVHVGSACCGGGGSPRLGVSAGRLLLERACEAIQCADGEMTVGDDLGACGCDTPSAGGGIAPTPVPAPEAGRAFGGLGG